MKQWATNTQVVAAANLSCGQYDPPYNGDYSVASCPVDYTVTGGGAEQVIWNPANVYSTNSAEVSKPHQNGWAVVTGAKAGNSCFRAFAVCIR